MKLIINADDFGISTDVNRAIIQAFEKGLITSSTIMTNMPGFEEAIDLIEKHNLHGRIGIHLNLSAGRPLTEGMRSSTTFCSGDGVFRPERQRLFLLSHEDKKAVLGEFQAQIQKVLERGIVPSHIDSHHHYHTEWAIGKLVIKLAKTNGINSIRLTRNYGQIPKYKRIYKNIFNGFIYRNDLAPVRYFGSAKDFAYCSAVCDAVKANLEVMVHPGINKDGRLVNLPEGIQLNQVVQEVINRFPEHALSGY